MEGGNSPHVDTVDRIFRCSKSDEGRKGAVVVRTKGDGDKRGKAWKLCRICTRYTKEGRTFRRWHIGATGKDRYRLEAKQQNDVVRGCRWWLRRGREKEGLSVVAETWERERRDARS